MNIFWSREPLFEPFYHLVTICPEDPNIYSLERWGFLMRLFNFVDFVDRDYETVKDSLRSDLTYYLKPLFRTILTKLDEACSVDLPNISDQDSYKSFLALLFTDIDDIGLKESKYFFRTL